jgi:hypothetical protein
VGLSGVLAVAGCSGSGGSDSENETPTPDATDPSTQPDEETELDETAETEVISPTTTLAPTSPSDEDSDSDDDSELDPYTESETTDESGDDPGTPPNLFSTPGDEDSTTDTPDDSSDVASEPPGIPSPTGDEDSTTESASTTETQTTSTSTESSTSTPASSTETSEQITQVAADDGDDSDEFGRAVTLSDDATTALVGAYNDEDPNGTEAGSAYVFTHENGSWSQQAKLVADDGDSEDRFGWSVALSNDGTTALVGAKYDEDPNGANEDGFGAGSAYVFTADSGSWSQQAKLVAEDGDGGDEFGESVALTGDGATALVGASADEDPNGEDAGSAYVFTADGDTWSQQAKVSPDDGDSSDSFGWSVDLSDDGATALIGAPGDEEYGGGQYTGVGSAYVFTENGGSWSQDAKLGPDGNDNQLFGRSVALSDDGSTAVVGDHGDEDPNGISGGSAYVFDDSGGTWSQQAKLAPDDGDWGDRFGRSVALTGDGSTVLIGAYNDEDPNGSGEGFLSGAGSAYEFTRDDGSWREEAKLSAEDGDGGDNFGHSVALAETTALVGASGDEDPNGEDAGSAYLFEL